MTDAIVKTLDLRCTAAHAFDVFVTRIGVWWPLDSHAASAADGKAALGVTIEPRVGGRVYETKHDGSTDAWGEVLDIQPGARLAITWHPGTNKANPTRVEVAFQDLGPGQCRVTLTHSGWEIWVDRAGAMRGNYNSGWDIVFGQCYRAAA